MIPELIGRLPVLTHLDPLDADVLRAILVQPKNAIIKQYQQLFEIENINLIIENEVYDFIVEKAIDFKLGARGLRSICEALLTDAMYDLPSTPDIKDFHLTLEYATSKFNQSKLSQLKIAS